MKKKSEFTKIKPDIRELTIKNGLSYPSDEELIMMILGRGTKTNPIEHLACEIINVLDRSSNANLLENLMQLDGVGKSNALAIASALEFGKRKNSYRRALINKPSDILPFIQHYALKTSEHFICITLNGSREIIDIHVISVGGLNKAFIHPRDVFSYAVSERASAIIVCHNHPLGNPNPSNADFDCTAKLLKVSRILGIALLDHIIITKNAHFSFLENGVLESTDEIDEE